MKRNDDEFTGREGVNYKDDNVDDAGEGVGQADGNDKKEIGNDDRIDDNVNGVGWANKNGRWIGMMIKSLSIY